MGSKEGGSVGCKVVGVVGGSDESGVGGLVGSGGGCGEGLGAGGLVGGPQSGTLQYSHLDLGSVV